MHSAIDSACPWSRNSPELIPPTRVLLTITFSSQSSALHFAIIVGVGVVVVASEGTVAGVTDGVVEVVVAVVVNDPLSSSCFSSASGETSVS